MITKPKGTYDLYGEQMKKWQYVSRVVDEVMERYNYNLIRTPIFENINSYTNYFGINSRVITS